MAAERLDSEQARPFLSAAFLVARSPVRSTTWSTAAFAALEVASAERPSLLAPTLVFDLTVLLQGERLQPISVTVPIVLRDALRAYEDHVLAPLLADPRWIRVADATVAAPKELKATAVAMVATEVLARLGVADGTGVSQAVVRRMATLPIADVLEEGRRGLEMPTIAGRLADGFRVLAQAARKTRAILSDAEVFTVENIASLKSLGARVALAQLATAAQQVGERLPKRIKGHVFEDGDAPTALEEDSAFPVGGFSSLATVGSLENLVTSELMYMDDPSASRPDLFDVRFVESELLYYARDESVAVRRKRRVVLVLDESLVLARVLDAKATFQRLVWLLASLSALVRTMADWFDSEALTFEWVFIKGREAPLREEMGVVALVLREFRERGQVEINEGESVAQVCLKTRQAWRQRARLFVFASTFPQGVPEEANPDAFIVLRDERPEVSWRAGGFGATPPPDSAQPAEAFAHLTRVLLDALLEPGSHRRKSDSSAPRRFSGTTERTSRAFKTRH